MLNGNIQSITNGKSNGLLFLLFFKTFKYILKNSLKKQQIQLSSLELSRVGWKILFYYPGKTNLSAETADSIFKNIILFKNFNNKDAFLIGACCNPDITLQQVQQLINKFEYNYVISF